MSYPVMAWVEDHSPYRPAEPGAHKTTYQVHHYLAVRANAAHDWRIWLWQRTIGEKIGLSRQAVNKAMHHLVADGYLEVLEETTGRAKLYRLHGPWNEPRMTPRVNQGDTIKEDDPEGVKEDTHPEPDWGRSRWSGNRGPDPPERLLRLWAELQDRQPTGAWLARHRRLAAEFLAQFPAAYERADRFLRWAHGQGTWSAAGWVQVYPRYVGLGGGSVGVRPSPAPEELAALLARRAELLAEAEAEPTGPLDLATVPRALRQVVTRGAHRRGVEVVGSHAW